MRADAIWSPPAGVFDGRLSRILIQAPALLCLGLRQSYPDCGVAALYASAVWVRNFPYSIYKRLGVEFNAQHEVLCYSESSALALRIRLGDRNDTSTMIAIG